MASDFDLRNVCSNVYVFFIKQSSTCIILAIFDLWRQIYLKCVEREKESVLYFFENLSCYTLFKIYIPICKYSLLSELMIHQQYCIRSLTSDVDLRNIYSNVYVFFIKQINDPSEILYSIFGIRNIYSNVYVFFIK